MGRLARRGDAREVIGLILGDSPMTKQVEVITSVQRRRRWPRAEKERIVAAALEPGGAAGRGGGCEGGGRGTSGPKRVGPPTQRAFAPTRNRGAGGTESTAHRLPATTPRHAA